MRHGALKNTRKSVGRKFQKLVSRGSFQAGNLRLSENAPPHAFQTRNPPAALFNSEQTRARTGCLFGANGLAALLSQSSRSARPGRDVEPSDSPAIWDQLRSTKRRPEANCQWALRAAGGTTKRQEEMNRDQIRGTAKIAKPPTHDRSIKSNGAPKFETAIRTDRAEKEIQRAVGDVLSALRAL